MAFNLDHSVWTGLILMFDVNKGVYQNKYMFKNPPSHRKISTNFGKGVDQNPVRIARLKCDFSKFFGGTGGGNIHISFDKHR